ncbi:MAG: type II secretion system protein [Desulfosalsimonas sp.]
MNSDAAFTLIELIVVISLIGVMLFFAVARLDRSFFTDDSRRFSGWLLTNVRDLKSTAVEKQEKFALYVDLEGNRIWREAASRKQDRTGNEEGPEKISLPAGHRFTGVMFSQDLEVTSGIAKIYFYPGGYSDRAIIRVRKNDGSRASYRIESFLPHASMTEGYEEF